MPKNKKILVYLDTGLPLEKGLTIFKDKLNAKTYVLEPTRQGENTYRRYLCSKYAYDFNRFVIQDTGRFLSPEEYRYVKIEGRMKYAKYTLIREVNGETIS